MNTQIIINTEIYLCYVMLDCIDKSISKNRRDSNNGINKIESVYRSTDVYIIVTKELTNGTVIKMEYILNRKNSFNSQFEIVWAGLSDNNTI